MRALNICVFFVGSRVILFVCLFVYVMFDNVLTAEKVFVTMTMLNTVRLSMTLMFPQAIAAQAELRTSVKRLHAFLMLEELDHSNLVNTGSEHYGSKAEVDVERACASYNPEHPYPTLQDISVSLRPGDLLAIIGKVGSSKTAFMMSLLGELPLTSGSIKIKGSLSYASQETWTFNDSIRQNILFGKEYDEKLYRKVIEVCALERDLELMPMGDRTLVGEKGYQLSGGQKARLNLARAVYRESDIFLMDDPLSAVDSGVAEHILDKCILDHLKDKIRILITHQIQFVEKATKILVLQDGRCLAFGTYKELEEQEIDFMSLMESDQVDENETQDGHPRRRRLTSVSSEELADILSSTPKTPSKLKSLSRREIYSKIDEESNENSDNEDDNDETTPALKIPEEHRFQGSIKGRVYFEYFRAGATWFIMTVMISFSFISQIFYHGCDIFLAHWTNKNQEIQNSYLNNSMSYETKMMFGNMTADEQALLQKKDSMIYAGIIAILFFSTLVRSVSFFNICNRSSRNLHNQIFARIIRTPVRFFDQNPTGRILNRFTNDLGIIDESLPFVAFDLNLVSNVIYEWFLNN